MNNDYKLHTACRVCGSEKLSQYLDLGLMPLSNNLCDTQKEEAIRYPLKVLLCEDCALSQLSIVIDPEILFGHYVYRSSISQGYVDHCRQMAKDLKEKYGLNENSFHIDIAGNDGALLHEFKQEIGYYKCLNVDPAKNLYEHNEAQGIRMFCKFWGIEAADHLISTDWPKADLITATNVFAHVDNVREFIEAVKMTLKPSGVLVMEFPYLIDFIENNEFDTIYFEHLSYFSIAPLYRLCKEVGLKVIEVEKQEIHGGSVRVTIGYGESNNTPEALMLNEMSSGYHNIETYHQWANKIARVIYKFRNNIMKLKKEGNKIAGFAASAKGNTLLNCAGIGYSDIDYLVDETPEKIGKFSPGTGIPIVSMDSFKKAVPDYLVILSWNFADEIIKKCQEAGYKGKFILPLTFEII